MVAVCAVDRTIERWYLNIPEKVFVLAGGRYAQQLDGWIITLGLVPGEPETHKVDALGSRFKLVANAARARGTVEIDGAQPTGEIPNAATFQVNAGTAVGGWESECSPTGTGDSSEIHIRICSPEVTVSIGAVHN